MNIIFIHGNFPGQFKHLLFNLAEVDGIETYFLRNLRIRDSQSRKTRTYRMRQVRHHYLTTTEGISGAKHRKIKRAL